jgi:single-stranded DNA-binding protein
LSIVAASTVYIDVAGFEKTAQACAQHLAKGREVGVTGRLVYREWTGADGTKRSRHSVVATRVEFGSRPRGEDGAGQEAEAAAAARDADHERARMGRRGRRAAAVVAAPPQGPRPRAGAGLPGRRLPRR